jgi:hypothetical protein
MEAVVLEIVNDWCTVCNSVTPVECVVLGAEHVCLECILDAEEDLKPAPVLELEPVG